MVLSLNFQEVNARFFPALQQARSQVLRFEWEKIRFQRNNNF